MTGVIRAGILGLRRNCCRATPYRLVQNGWHAHIVIAPRLPGLHLEGVSTGWGSALSYLADCILAAG